VSAGRAALAVTRDDLRSVCGSTLWVSLVAGAAPYSARDELHAAADEAFDELSEEDWLEAFAHHPRIGDVAALRERFAASGAHSEREQSALADVSEETLVELAVGNTTYETCFGFVFLVRAAGRTAGELLQIQRERLDHPRDIELAIAAQQQREITHLRIDQIFAD